MFKFLKHNHFYENKLYNKILSLSRNKLFYSKLSLDDTFQNRIHLIFLHISFLFLKIKRNKSINYKEFDQRMFDLVFKKIELNMREIGYGDVNVNKNMKLLVKNFYNILLKCELYQDESLENKKLLLKNYLTQNKHKKGINNILLVEYFDMYCAFCLDLSYDSVLKGELNFTYK